MSYPQYVKVVEVGPRDGLQNELLFVDTETKIELIDRLSQTGLPAIEVTSFVHPKSIPQLADAEAVFTRIRRSAGVSYRALVPNSQGLERALSVGATEIAVFTAASETFNQRNIHCGIEESLVRFEPVLERAKALGIKVRGYISCALGCPYEGAVATEKVAELAHRLFEMGCDEISLGDTIGIGTPSQASQLVVAVTCHVPIESIAVHFHDTRGQALANILACLQLGVSIVDASVAGLGGCPYAKGATGNVATEDLIYMLHGMGIKTGVDLNKLIEVGHFISHKLGRENQSRVGRAGLESRA